MKYVLGALLLSACASGASLRGIPEPLEIQTAIEAGGISETVASRCSRSYEVWEPKLRAASQRFDDPPSAVLVLGSERLYLSALLVGTVGGDPTVMHLDPNRVRTTAIGRDELKVLVTQLQSSVPIPYAPSSALHPQCAIAKKSDGTLVAVPADQLDQGDFPVAKAFQVMALKLYGPSPP